jgi:long-chain fatty acid transport protein
VILFRRLLLPAVLAWAAIVFPETGRAAAYRFLEQDAQATARGGAFAATADNPSAIFYNPAGLTQLEGFNFTSGLYAVNVDVNYTTLDGKRESGNELRAPVVPNLYAAYSLPKLPLAVGLGVYSSYGLGLSYPDDAPFRNRAKESQIVYISVAPVLAWEITKGLSIAAGPTFNYSQAKLVQGVFSEGDGLIFRGSGIAAGYEIGLRWQPCEQHAFGVTYHSSSNVNLGGHTALSLRPGLAAGDPTLVRFPEEDANARLNFPRIIIAGYSFRPTPAWNIEFNLDWTDWDSLNRVAIHQQRSPSLPLVFEYESSFVYRFGVTRKFENGFQVSGGYTFVENSVPERTFTPAVPDGDRHGISVGLSKKSGRWDYSFGYQFNYAPERTIRNGTPADGRYELFINAVSASISRQF